MRAGLLFRCSLLLVGSAAVAGAQAATFTCKDPTGRTTIQQTPCPVVNDPAPPPPPKPPCTLDPEQVQRAIRQERQFLGRYGDEASHRRAQVADLQAVVDRIRGARLRFDELVEQRKPLDKERAFYPPGTPMPAWLKTKIDANDAQFTALVDILRGHEQEIAGIQKRYQCERDTYGKLWSGAASGSSACDRPACASP